jgi:phosphoribosylformylglycinamidine cyclo-ligase
MSGNEQNDRGVHYSQLVQYTEALDPFAKRALQLFAPTVENCRSAGVKLLEQSLGETAQVFEIDDSPFYLAVNVETLGTKVDVAVEMAKRDFANRGKYFSGVGQCTANMSLNDLVGVGARPFSYSLLVCIGDNEFVKDEVIRDALLRGYLKAANDAGAVIPGGETATVRGIVVAGEADLSGGSVGIISPRERFCHSGRVELGDSLFGVVVNTPMANGYTAIRRIGASLPHGYFTELPSGRTFGEAVLESTPGFAPIVTELNKVGVPVHYYQPITGHGFKKIARSKRDLTYQVDSLPEMPEVFQFIQNHARISTKEMLETYNCGVGFVIYAPSESGDAIIESGRRAGHEIFKMGQVLEGPRQVLVKPFDVSFTTKDIKGE